MNQSKEANSPLLFFLMRTFVSAMWACRKGTPGLSHSQAAQLYASSPIASAKRGLRCGPPMRLALVLGRALVFDRMRSKQQESRVSMPADERKIFVVPVEPIALPWRVSLGGPNAFRFRGYCQPTFFASQVRNATQRAPVTAERTARRANRLFASCFYCDAI